LNVRYIVTREHVDPLPPFLKLAHEGASYVYENLDVLPRATLLGRYRVVQPARAILDSIARGTSDSRDVVFLERDPGLVLGMVEGGAAVVSSYKLNEVVVDVDTPGPALLRLADAWYPDWAADIDGKAAPILKADYLLRAVPVPSGKHRVAFHFRSPAVGRGLAISLACLTTALLLLVVGYLPGRRNPADVPLARGAD
jgi:hypothetical protein